jgi:hypothetical protein
MFHRPIDVDPDPTAKQQAAVWMRPGVPSGQDLVEHGDVEADDRVIPARLYRAGAAASRAAHWSQRLPP